MRPECLHLGAVSQGAQDELTSSTFTEIGEAAAAPLSSPAQEDIESANKILGRPAMSLENSLVANCGVTGCARKIIAERGLPPIFLPNLCPKQM